MPTYTNHIINPSGETNTAGYTPVGATLNRVNTSPVYGSWRFEIITTGGGASQGIRTATDQIPATVGQVWQFSADLWGTGTVRFKLRTRNGATQIATYPGTNISLPATAARYTAEYTITDAATTAIELIIETPTTQIITFGVDGIMAQVGSSYYPSYFDGDSVDAIWTSTAHASTSTLTVPDPVAVGGVILLGQQSIGPLRVGRK